MDQDRVGVLAATLAAVGHRRRSAVDAYLDARSLPGGPAVMTGRPVRRILMVGDRAGGVELENRQRLRSPLIVVCAGAIQTPLLLARSGLTHRPVGARLKDHPSFAFTLALRRNGAEAGPHPRTISRLLRWSSGPDAVADLQAFVLDRVDDRAVARGAEQLASTGTPLAVAVVGLMAVSSVGHVTGPGLSRAAEPGAVIGALTTADDRRRLRAGVSHLDELLRGTEPSSLIEAVHVDDGGTPAAHLRNMDDDGRDRWIAAHPGPYSHPAGSCPMGPESDPGAVVDCQAGNRGRLLGYRGVYLADASIMPDLVRGGLQIPVVALAERIVADLG